MLVDLDRFKNINDTIGHEAGDQLLKQVAARLRACLRDSDIIARLGGDEFVILMQDASTIEAVTRVADKILEATSRPLIIDDQEFLITASIGISTYPHDGNDLQTLLKNSDRGDVPRQGIRQERFPVLLAGNERAYAASVCRSNRHCAARWNARNSRCTSSPKCGCPRAPSPAWKRWCAGTIPERACMQPGDFIAIAEETGMIVQIGDWVLEEACRTRAGHARGPVIADLRVAVNLSVRQLFDDGLAQPGR